MKARFGQTLVISFLILAVYSGLDDTKKGINNKISGFFFMSISMTMNSLMSALMTFQGERPVFLREYANKSYKTLPYFLSKSIIEIPV
jgi:hypothetical protein